MAEIDHHHPGSVGFQGLQQLHLGFHTDAVRQYTDHGAYPPHIFCQPFDFETLYLTNVVRGGDALLHHLFQLLFQQAVQFINAHGSGNANRGANLFYQGKHIAVIFEQCDSMPLHLTACFDQFLLARLLGRLPLGDRFVRRVQRRFQRVQTLQGTIDACLVQRAGFHFRRDTGYGVEYRQQAALPIKHIGSGFQGLQRGFTGIVACAQYLVIHGTRNHHPFKAHLSAQYIRNHHGRHACGPVFRVKRG
ncbi:MAG: hypothetical protein BWX80_04042 [Candidatus Hydrogenedentes bacterium ADurb.Bin101]|nr:MAG: hypothetical protein BWX80_04042 [Candidatus Hydrogenedentes bacterium ADurb.Bin101]